MQAQIVRIQQVYVKRDFGVLKDQGQDTKQLSQLVTQLQDIMLLLVQMFKSHVQEVLINPLPKKQAV